MKNNKLRYAIGMFGTSIPVNMFKTYAAIFYVDRLGLPMAKFSLVLLLYTFLDAIDNPIYGFLSDRTRTKWGRRRPWLVIGTPLLVLALIAFFNVPGFITGNGLFAYLLLAYCLTGTIDSLINANYGALFPELFPDDKQRAVTNAMRQAFQLVAMIISIALTPVVTSAIGYQLTSVIYGLLGGAVILYMTFGCHEILDAPELAEMPRFLESLKALATNQRFWIAGLANAFYSAAASMLTASMPFFVKYALGEPESMTTVLMASVLVVAIAGVAGWAYLIKRFSLLPVWRAALMFLAVMLIPLYLSKTLVPAIVSSILVGLGIAGTIATMDLIGARIMDEDRAKSGQKREGIISSAMGFMNRLNGIFTGLGFYLASTVFGFESGNNPGPNPGGAARFLLTLFPFGLMLLSLVFAMMFKEPARHDER